MIIEAGTTNRSECRCRVSARDRSPEVASFALMFFNTFNWPVHALSHDAPKLPLAKIECF
jgi:hypothetical protein